MFSIPQTPLSHSSLGGSSVKVYARTRPLLDLESLKGAKSILRVSKDEKQMVVEDTSEKLFKFENVFDENTPQDEVYKVAVEPLVSKAAHGQKVTVLAYGQTGSGKTYTMGTDPDSLKNEDGILQRTICYLLGRDEFDEALGKPKQSLKISFLEVYNELIYDLLTPTRKSLKVKTGSGGAVSPVGMIEEEVTSVAQGQELLIRGSHNRSVASTALNQHSSRSHALIYITVQKDDICGSLILVDLAGAECVGRAQTTGQQFTEGIHINKGLLTLGKVLSALSNPVPGYVPYRESVLTRLLKDSLGGASHTAMIACVNPASFNLHETLNTLRYAEQAQNIKTKPQALSTIKRFGGKRRWEDVTATPGAYKRRMMSGKKGDHNSTVSTPGHKPPRKNESKLNNTFTTPSLRINDTVFSSSFLVPPTGPIKQPIFEDDSPSRFSTVSTMENTELPTNLSPYMERMTNKLEQSIMGHFESIEDRVADRIINKLKSCKKSKSRRKSTRKISTGSGNSSDSSDDSMSSITMALLGGKTGKRIFKKLISDVLKDTQNQATEMKQFGKENKAQEEMSNPRNPLCDLSNVVNASEQPLTSTAFNSKRYVRKSTRLSTKRSLHNAIFDDMSPLCKTHSSVMSCSKLNETGYANNDATVIFNQYDSSKSAAHQLKLSTETLPGSFEETKLYQEVLSLPGKSTAPSKDGTFTVSPDIFSQSPLPIDRIYKKKPPVRRSQRLSALKATESNFKILTGSSPATSLCKQTFPKDCRLNVTVQATEDKGSAQGKPAVPKWKLVMSPTLQEDYYKDILEMLNNGTVRQLQSLPTIGPKTAMVLYNYRQMFGKFGSVEDLGNIPALPKSFYIRFMKANLMNRLSFDM